MIDYELLEIKLRLLTPCSPDFLHNLVMALKARKDDDFVWDFFKETPELLT